MLSGIQQRRIQRRLQMMKSRSSDGDLMRCAEQQAGKLGPDVGEPLNCSRQARPCGGSGGPTHLVDGAVTSRLPPSCSSLGSSNISKSPTDSQPLLWVPAFHSAN